jgi:hypothetical protein
MKYIAIKIKNLAPWMWFENEKVTRLDGRFVGRKGWGENGAYIDLLDIDEELIEGQIITDTLQYL